MAVSIVVAVSLLALVWVEILRKNWLHQDRNILTSGNKRDHVIRECLSLGWECFQARDEEPAYWKFGSGHTSCCWKGLSTVVFCTSKQGISSKGERVGFFSPFCFPIASLPILCLSEQNVDLLTCNGGSNPFLGGGDPHWKLPTAWVLCPSSPSTLWRRAGC